MSDYAIPAPTSGDIVDAVKAAGGSDLDKRRVELPAQIKSTGTHDVNVKIHDEVTGSFKIEVVAAS